MTSSTDPPLSAVPWGPGGGYLVLLGSNMADAARRLAKACGLLRHLDATCRFTHTVASDDWTGRTRRVYVNQLALLSGSLDRARVVSFLRDLERSLGRTPQDKALGRVPMDADLLAVPQGVLRPREIGLPVLSGLLDELTEQTQTDTMRTLGIIPARYASTRFPGKPLALLGGLPIIRRVYERVKEAVDTAVVATDDERIMDCVRSFGGRAVMTSPLHRSGTDRCREALDAITPEDGEYDVVVNIQGDEPFITPSQIRLAAGCFSDPACQISTLITPFGPRMGLEALRNPNSPKVTVDAQGYALYFSRSVIPYLRGVEPDRWLLEHVFYKHIGLYAFLPQVLRRVTHLEPSSLERAESLEQLRWIENGLRIKTAVTDSQTIGIDTPEDLARAEAFLQRS